MRHDHPEKVKALNLRGMGLTHIPKEICDYINLETVIFTAKRKGDLNYTNSIEEIPDYLLRLSKLKYIDLRDNNIKRGAEKLALLPRLEKLYISGISLNNEFLRTMSYCESLRTLVIDGAVITRVPREICRLQNLREFSLRNSSLKHVHGAIWKLVKLRKLDLSSNKLEHMPIGIGNLESLCEMVLSYNRLEVLPEQLRLMKNLQVLKLSGNRIKSIPHQIFSLRKLEELDISHNLLPYQGELIETLSKRFSIKALGCLHYN